MRTFTRTLMCFALFGLITSTIWAQEPAGETSRDIQKEIQKLIADGDLTGATAALDAAMEKINEQEGDELTVNGLMLANLRSQIGMGWLRSREEDKAIEQYRKAHDYYLANIEKPGAAAMLENTLRMVDSLYKRQAKAAESLALLEEASGRLQALQADGEISFATNLATLLGLQLTSPALSDEKALSIRNLIDTEMELIANYRTTHPDDVNGTIAMSRMLEVAARASSENAEKAAELVAQRESLLTEALSANLESAPIANEYSSAMLAKISSSYRDEPEAAQASLNQALELLTKANEKSDSRMDRTIANLKSWESRIASAIKVKEMIGQPAPAVDVEAWVNNDVAVSLESLKGKVVLLDFWAVWCGPCIATFPHLREWRDEFHSQGFEVVGVTRYYNYKWDEEAKRAVRAEGDEKISPEDEQAAVAAFMKSHSLQHPSIITPSDSKMQSEYGVTGIPHAVLLDRQGNVRMIKVGSGEANAKALHETIKILLEEKFDD